MQYRHPDDALLDLQRMPGYTPPDNFRYVIPEDARDMRHSQDKPFCLLDPDCPCHEDPLLIAEVTQDVGNGLCTPDEASRIVKGEQI